MFRVKQYQIFIVLFICLSTLPCLGSKGSVPALEREVSLNAKNEKVSVILGKIAEQCSVIFSYSPLLLKDVALVNLQVKNKRIREVLATILPLTINFSSKNNYIILKEKDLSKNSKNQQINGYVYDVQTDKKIANVTVYDKKSLQSATTDEYGYYSISVPVSNSSITVNRINYEDTAILVPPHSSSAITNIAIQAKSDSIIKKDSALWQKKLHLLNTQTERLINNWNNYMHSVNVQDSINRYLQVSFLPFIGSNHKLSGNVYNNLSFNILGGYSRGTKEFELGGIFNIDKENVKGVQIAGMFNMVGDSMRGVQVGGLSNINGKRTNGIQIAGLSNVNGGPVKGVQIAGLLNKNENKVNGLQIAGMINYNEHFTGGTAIAGLINLNEHAEGLQIAGLSNMNDTATAFLISGCINISGYHKNSSAVAGLMNYSQSGESKLQIATLFNRTQHLSGIQLGLINISDSASGIPIGLFSFVKKGLHQLEISADEVQYFNLNFRTGVPVFYTIASFGLQPYQGTLLWSYGYGLGTSFPIKGKFKSDVTIQSKHISIGSYYPYSSQRIQLYWGLEYKIHSKFSIACGPVLNLYMSEVGIEPNNYLGIAPPYSAKSSSIDGRQSQYWLGAQISLRFF